MDETPLVFAGRAQTDLGDKPSGPGHHSSETHQIGAGANPIENAA